MHKYYAQYNGEVYYTITAQFEVVHYRFSLCFRVLNNLFSLRSVPNLYLETL